jgi:FAD/FMN-containing dehydrogenase
VTDGASASSSGPEVVARLAALVGEGHVVTDPPALAPYARDKSPFPGLTPAVVVRPADVAEVAAVVALANELRLALLPRGAGFSIAGYPPATRSPVVFLDTRRLDRVLDIDEVNMTVTAQAGIVTADLDAQVAARGFQVHTVAVPIRFTTLGGVLSGVVGGGIPLDSTAVGLTGQHVLGLKVVLPTGEIVATNAGGSNRHRGTSALADADGPSLTSMFLGDGGSLGVKVEATLSLTPAARHTHADAWLMPDFDATWRAFRELMAPRELPVVWLSAAGTDEDAWEVDVVSTAADERLLGPAVETVERVLRARGGREAPPRRRAQAADFATPGADWTAAIVDLDRALLAFAFGNRDFADGLRSVRTLLHRRFAERGLDELGLGLKVVFAPLTRHAAYTSISITYDPSIAGGREATADLAREAYALVGELGGYAEPHQGEAARILADSWAPGYARLIGRIKAALDPNDVLNPGLWSR